MGTGNMLENIIVLFYVLKCEMFNVRCVRVCKQRSPRAFYEKQKELPTIKMHDQFYDGRFCFVLRRKAQMVFYGF